MALAWRPLFKFAVVGDYVKAVVRVEELNAYPTIANLGVILGEVRASGG